MVFSQRASPESWLLAPARPVARSLRSHRPRPGPSAPRGGALQGAGVLPVAGVGGPLPGRRALRARRPGAPGVRAGAHANDPENIRKTSEARLQNQKKIPADFLSISAKTNEHGALRTSSISCPQRCAHFCGTSQMNQIIRKPSVIGLRHMPALRVGILMHSWSSSAALLIRDRVLRSRPGWALPSFDDSDDRWQILV